MSQELERVYTINLGKVLLSPDNQRAKRAINMIKEFARHHMKTEEIKIEEDVAHQIWSKGIRSPPRKIRVRMSKTEDGAILVSRYEEGVEEAVKPAAETPKVEEKAPEMEVEEKKVVEPEAKKEAPEMEVKDPEPKADEKKVAEPEAKKEAPEMEVKDPEPKADEKKVEEVAEPEAKKEAPEMEVKDPEPKADEKKVEEKAPESEAKKEEKSE